MERVESRDSHCALFPVAELRRTTNYLYVESFHGDAPDETRLVDSTRSPASVLLFRFGGEESVAGARDTDRAGALTAFENLPRSIAGHRFPPLGTISVSVGVLELGERHEAMILLDRADRALYFAKQNGRDQVALYEDLVERSMIEEARARIGGIALL